MQHTRDYDHQLPRREYKQLNHGHSVDDPAGTELAEYFNQCCQVEGGAWCAYKMCSTEVRVEFAERFAAPLARDLLLRVSPTLVTLECQRAFHESHTVTLAVRPYHGVTTVCFLPSPERRRVEASTNWSETLRAQRI